MFRQFVFKTYSLVSRGLIAIISGYRYFISPWLGNRCRFYPSCSEYSQEAILKLGMAKGLALTVWRILRCHPYHPGGYDPVLNEGKSNEL